MKKIKQLFWRLVAWLVSPVAHLLGGVNSSESAKKDEGEQNGKRISINKKLKGKGKQNT